MRTPAKTRVQVPQNAHSDTKQALSVANSGLTKLAERYANTNSPGRGGHGLAITLSFKAVAWLRTAVSGATVSSSPPGGQAQVGQEGVGAQADLGWGDRSQGNKVCLWLASKIGSLRLLSKNAS